MTQSADSRMNTRKEKKSSITAGELAKIRVEGWKTVVTKDHVSVGSYINLQQCTIFSLCSSTEYVDLQYHIKKSSS